MGVCICRGDVLDSIGGIDASAGLHLGTMSGEFIMREDSIMTPEERRAAKQLDREIEAIFYHDCPGVQVNILDLGRIFDAGRKAHREGRDIKEAVMSFVETIRKIT